MPSDTLSDMKTITAQTAKEARWEVQRRVSKLNIAPVRIGILGWAVNLILRRPADFPTFEFARFRREIAGQARRFPLDGADIAVVKFRARLLSSTIDARFSKPVTGADVDAVVDDVVAAAERQDEVTFSASDREQVADATWKQYADFFGFPAARRAHQIEDAAEFVPHGGPALAGRLREVEAQAAETARARPRQR